MPVASWRAVVAEKAVVMLALEMGKDAARMRVEEGRPDLPGLVEPEGYLGSAEEFRRRLLGER